MLPKDSVFIGTIRDPFSQMKSRFRQFGLAKQFGIPKGIDPIEIFMKDPRKIEIKQRIKEKKKGKNVYTMTRNFLLFQYGANETQLLNRKYVKSYIGLSGQRISFYCRYKTLP